MHCKLTSNEKQRRGEPRFCARERLQPFTLLSFLAPQLKKVSATNGTVSYVSRSYVDGATASSAWYS